MKVMKFTVSMLLAYLFCLLKREKNKDERQRHLRFIYYIVSIFLLPQGYETQQTI